MNFHLFSPYLLISALPSLRPPPRRARLTAAIHYCLPSRFLPATAGTTTPLIPTRRRPFLRPCTDLGAHLACSSRARVKGFDNLLMNASRYGATRLHSSIYSPDRAPRTTTRSERKKKKTKTQALPFLRVFNPRVRSSLFRSIELG